MMAGMTNKVTAVSLTGAAPIFRRLAFKYHPDRSPQTSEMMRDLNELWQAVQRDIANASH
jgi:hypothetical protein